MLVKSEVAYPDVSKHLIARFKATYIGCGWHGADRCSYPGNYSVLHWWIY